MLNSGIHFFPDKTFKDIVTFFAGQNEETYTSIYNNFTRQWLLMELNHRVSLTASNAFWKLSTRYLPDLMEAKVRERRTRKIPQFRSIRQSLYKENVPRISLDFGYEVKSTGDIIILSDLDSTPTSKFPPSEYRKLYETAKIKVNIHLEINQFTCLEIVVIFFKGSVGQIYPTYNIFFFILVRFSFSLQASDFIALHESKCKNKERDRPVQISCDGVSECRSNTNSLDVYSARFKNCRVVYPHTIVRPTSKYKMDPYKYLTYFIDDMSNNQCTIKAFVADNLKRAHARAALNHASSFPCEYCQSKATSISLGGQQLLVRKRNLEQQILTMQKKIERLQEQDGHEEEELEGFNLVLDSLTTSLRDIQHKKKQLVWPASTMNGEPRTKENILEIVEKITNGEALTKDEKKGIVGKSPFLDLDYFDPVRDIPAEYLHCLCLGVVKRMVCLTFNVGVNRPRLTKRKLTPPSVFNSLMSKIKVVHEFSRRIRNLDFSVLKKQEFRNICLFYFPVVVNCIQEHENERRVWLLLAYLMRACVIPQHEFQKINLSVISQCGKQFYTQYEKTYGQFNCSYNTHLVGSHMLEIRAHGPLTLTSAFGFENFYGEMRHSFVPGTISPLKQIMQKVLVKRALTEHTCLPSIHITTHDTPLECNNLIYTFTNREYNLYKVVDIQNDEDILNCIKINTSEVFYEETPNLNWDLVGVFKKESIETTVVNINQKYVAGKLLQIDDILITCPKNVLDEK